MTVFACVPVFAPVVGAGLIKFMPWRGTFVVCAGFGMVLALWSLRLPESLPVERRQPLQLRQVGVATMAIVRSRAALLYTLASVAVFGSFSSYLATSERVIDEVFHRRSWFPFVFGGTAILMGAASMAVGRSVERIGLDRLIRWALFGYTISAVLMYAVSRGAGGRPNFWPWIALLAIVLVFYNVLFPNLNAATMIPVGHVAGTAAAVYATVTTAAGAVVGERLDKAFDGTVNPFSLSFAIAGLVALGLVLAVGHAGSREVR
jgi:DHA1 family bicyclomycin/chloramphenicol resistance-like MFS transporter